MPSYRDDIPNSLRLLSASFHHTSPPQIGNADLCSLAASEIDRLREVLARISKSGEDGTYDSVAPEAWAGCREMAQQALEANP